MTYIEAIGYILYIIGFIVGGVEVYRMYNGYNKFKKLFLRSGKRKRY